MVSQDIQNNRERYLEIMHGHGSLPSSAIVESVRETQLQLQEILRAVDEEQAHRKPAPGEWGLRDLTLHAAFTERLMAKLIHHLARGEGPSAEDLVGAGIGMMPADDGRTYAEAVAELERMNEAVLAAVGSLPEEPNLEMRLPHPFFGPLNCREWAGFQRVHDLDHIQHARRIIAAIGG
jgi:hypothetical protein